jgi:hypothetical protein
MNLLNKRGWPMHSYEILTLFGLPPSGPIPPDYEDMRVIDNIMVHIFPRGKNPRNIKRRVVATCPHCFKMVCAGHLYQHLAMHKRKNHHEYL